MLKILCAAALMLTTISPALAAPEPKDPKKQTPWGLYLTAAEAFALKQAKGPDVLFVDVREPIEIMFTGFTDVVDINIPYLLVNPSEVELQETGPCDGAESGFCRWCKKRRSRRVGSISQRR